MSIVKLTFLGDVMCKSQMFDPYCTGENTYDFSSLFTGMKEYMAKSDFVLANLETPISYDNNGLTTEQYRFCSPFEFAQAAHAAGIDFVATANNHCLDRGIEGINSTVKVLNDIGIYHTGVFSKKDNKPLIVNVKGLKIGLLSYTYGTNAFSNHNYLKRKDAWRVNLFQNQELSNPVTRYCINNKGRLAARLYRKLEKRLYPVNIGRKIYERREFSYSKRRRLLRDIREMKKHKPDIIVMYMHAGGQYNREATSDTKALAEFLVGHGIDIVAGSHEHVVHGGSFDRLSQGKLITYSLGNFDGVAGVYESPFDKMAEYSIAWNVYINAETAKIVKSTYSVLKTVEEKDKKYGIRTVPVYDLISNEKDQAKKQKLIEDTEIIAERFSGRKVPAQMLGDEIDI